VPSPVTTTRVRVMVMPSLQVLELVLRVDAARAVSPGRAR
jgi:hypothetical protein